MQAGDGAGVGVGVGFGLGVGFGVGTIVVAGRSFFRGQLSASAQ
jgi:hypothetical protein